MRLHDITALQPDDQLLLDFLVLRFPDIDFQFDGTNFSHLTGARHNARITWTPGDPTRAFWLRSAKNWAKAGRPTHRIHQF